MDEKIRRYLLVALWTIGVALATRQIMLASNANITQLDETNLMISEVNASFDRRVTLIEHQLYDLWFGTLDEDAFEKIQDWEESNDDYIDCTKTYKGFRIERGFYSTSASPAKVLVGELEKGYQVWGRDGSVNCYPDYISGLNPTPINCTDLCERNVTSGVKVQIQNMTKVESV